TAGGNGTRNAAQTGEQDGCRAWLVAFTCFLIQFVTGGLGRLFAIVFVALMDRYGVGREMAAYPLSIHLAVKNLFGEKFLK
ncbi:hypothetical protein NPIL_233561, partial [Nephila pilipes]